MCLRETSTISHKTKTITIKQLQEQGFPVTEGSKYIPKSWIPKNNITLAEVHKRLSKIKGSLDKEILQLRREETL